MSNTVNLELPLLSPSQAQKHVTHNEALLILDALTQSRIIDRGLSTPPVSPSEGDTYIVGPSPTGDWASSENYVASFIGGVWRLHEPKSGWLVYVLDEEIHLKYTGTNWVAAFTQSGSTWGWQDWSHGGSSQNLTAAETFYTLENDGAGSYTSTSYKVPSHGDIWNTTTNQLDFSDLSIGDEVTLRVDVNVTTAGSNHEITLKATFDIGGTPFDLTLYQSQFKDSGSHKIICSVPFYIGSAGVRDNPAEIKMASDSTGDSVQVNGWYIKTQVR